ncbi:hypothetical protein [Roseobacter weihaiensis]|uniref:hypothetical protein n=1 Tax=Roseobacter weihaiensis TaxID=2763262 RepID=UPI001D09E7E1|nr:hypothetical protein [Roseobacter sp. H9]
MKKIFAIFVALTLPLGPLAAQDDDGTSLMERGAQQFLEGLLQEIEPAWTEMQGFMDAMGPAMIELMEEVKDWSVYDPPEILDNGDIIIRRKPDPENRPIPDPERDPAPELTPQIEL